MSETISIIIPAYNTSKYIDRMIESVCNQTYKDLEIIIVDDGSTDDTLSICNDYAKKDSRIQVFHKENEGVTKARDFGIYKSSGKYLAFVDSDDTIEPEMYEILYNNLIKYNADISHCGHKTIFPNGNIDYHFNTKEIRDQDNKTGVIDLMMGDKVEPGLCTKLYRKCLFNALQYDKSMKINEDYVINLLVFSKAKKSIFIDIPLYNYFMNDSSASHQNTKKYYYLDILKAADFTRDYFKNDNVIYPYAEKRWFKTYSDMYKNQGLIDDCVMEFDRSSLLNNVLFTLKSEYKKLKKNKCFNRKDKFILKMIRFFPNILVYICKLR